MLCGNNAFYGGLLFSLNKTIIQALAARSSDILRIVRGESGFLVDSVGSVVSEQQLLAGIGRVDGDCLVGLLRCVVWEQRMIGIKKVYSRSNWFFPIFFFWLELKESKFFWRRSYWSIDAWWLPSQSQGFLPCSQLPPQPLLPKNFLRRIHRVFEFFFVYWQGSLP